MNTALDYDGTYTEDPQLWEMLINVATHLVHKVYIVTMRYPEEAIRHKVGAEVHYTSRQAKRRYMQNIGIAFQVWVDDIPEFILHSTQEALWPDEATNMYNCGTPDCNLPLRSKHDELCVVCQRNNGARTES